MSPFTVTIPEALTGTFNVRVGLYQPADGRRAVLAGPDDPERSYLIGRLTVNAGQIVFQAARPEASPLADLALFTRADNGWAAAFHPLDRFVKNTYEILSPLNELTARLPMTDHRFLTPDRKVTRTMFGEGDASVMLVVNTVNTNVVCRSRLGGEVTLPPYGFLVESRSFVAFHAASWAGLRYDTPPLFTLRSLDGKPLSSSRKVRVFHAFGNDQVRFRNATWTVRTEAGVP